ncbi:hypothetical protein STEG23_020194 [Scotinomys teguina]
MEELALLLTKYSNLKSRSCIWPGQTSKASHGDREQRAFESIKQELSEAPALGLPDISKPFHLYVNEKRGIAKKILIQTLGPWKRSVAYLSNWFDPVAEVPPRPPRELRDLQDGSSGAQRGARGTDTDRTARKLELQDISG